MDPLNQADDDASLWKGPQDPFHAMLREISSRRMITAEDVHAAFVNSNGSKGNADRAVLDAFRNRLPDPRFTPQGLAAYAVHLMEDLDRDYANDLFRALIAHGKRNPWVWTQVRVRECNQRLRRGLSLLASYVRETGMCPIETFNSRPFTFRFQPETEPNLRIQELLAQLKEKQG